MGICFPRRICWFSIFLVVKNNLHGKLFYLLVLLMLQKEGKTYLGILEGLQRASSPLLWWLQHLQSWQHLQKQARVSVSVVGQTAGVTSSGGTNPGPFLQSWLAQGCRHTSGRSWAWARVGRQQRCFHPPQPLLDCTHWTSSQESPEAIPGSQRDPSPLSFQTTLAHTYSNSAWDLCWNTDSNCWKIQGLLGQIFIGRERSCAS